ncbi:RNA polymerase sigma factor [Persicobacter psychrovividus]|uniref:RNA polymerase sigma factor n=1 Tax=Persicobacter psychrovividus TaxID=387638 RepID=A0ABM7VET2_9BACT|nr:RNA polymerase sigma factor [Persicobacter psychrovividus]
MQEEVEFEKDLKRLFPQLYSAAYKFTQDYDRAKDLVQETMIKAFKARTKFRRGTNLKAWLLVILKNTFFTSYQSEKRRGEQLDTMDQLDAFLGWKGGSNDNLADSNMGEQEIRREIDRLDKQYKMPFMLHFQGFSYAEIGEKLSLPMGTVKNRIHLARKVLKEKLSNFRR